MKKLSDEQLKNALNKVVEILEYKGFKVLYKSHDFHSITINGHEQVFSCSWDVWNYLSGINAGMSLISPGGYATKLQEIA